MGAVDVERRQVSRNVISHEPIRRYNKGYHNMGKRARNTT